LQLSLGFGFGLHAVILHGFGSAPRRPLNSTWGSGSPKRCRHLLGDLVEIELAQFLEWPWHRGQRNHFCLPHADHEIPLSGLWPHAKKRSVGISNGLGSAQGVGPARNETSLCVKSWKVLAWFDCYLVSIDCHLGGWTHGHDRALELGR
jgi:hypothetical protein